MRTVKYLFRLLLALALSASIYAATTPTKKSSPKTRSKRRAKSSGPAVQAHPDSSRYSEIQKALADRGYYKGEANGAWNGDSADALRRFQADQKIPNDGKIDALSLTALGLGPRHEAVPPVPHSQ